MADVQLPVSIDFETFLITKTEPLPKPVCLSICWGLEEEQDLIHARDPACKRVLRDLIENAALSKLKLSGFYVAYDMGLACEWFDLWDQVDAAYQAKSIHCSMIRQKLIDIARGQLKGYHGDWNEDKGKHDWNAHDYNLDEVGQRHGVPKLDKDTWRMRYGELYSVPVLHWEDAAKNYALDDTMADHLVHIGQLEYAHFLDNEFDQAETSFHLALTSASGQSTDPLMVAQFKKFIQRRIDQSHQLLLDNKYIVWQPKKEKWKKEQKRVKEYARKVWATKGLPFPKTKAGDISLDKEAVEASGDKILIAYQIFGSANTQMDRANELEDGIDGRIHTRFDELKKSGRTSSSKPNVQNRTTDPVGDRESFVGGWYFDPISGTFKRKILIDMDFDGLELRTISQGCKYAVGWSDLGDILNAGEDPHLIVAAKLCNTTYDDAKLRYKQKDPEIVDARGAGKAKMVNFSCWAGTTVKGLNNHAREVGYDHSMQESADIYKAFTDSWSEATHYFDWVRRQGGMAGMHTMMCFQSRRFAGMLTYTEACSIISQGLGADATKEALRALVRHCYFIKNSPLYGSRPFNFIHDQYQLEVDDDEHANDKAEFAGQVAREAANKWLPDVPTRAKPMLTRRWSKMAEPVKDGAGKLVPWDFDMLGPVDPKGRPWPLHIMEMQEVAKLSRAA